jgi:P27 family predicted phage terminase small subunit
VATGRPPKPTALKVLEGNPGKRGLNQSEPKPPEGPVKAPNWLRGRGRTAWKWIAPVLEPMGVLTTADTHALALLCDAYAEYIESRAVVRRLGATYESRVFRASTRRADDADADVEEELEGQPHGGALLRRRATPGDDDFDAGEWSVIIRPRPEVKMASDAWRRVQRMLTEFGMTASSRSKLYVAMAEAEGDPFAEWERGGRSAS